MRVFDSETGKEEQVIRQSSNSYLVTQSKSGKNGINCENWFNEDIFRRRFKTYKVEMRERANEKIDVFFKALGDK